jgi:hypothetical protein
MWNAKPERSGNSYRCEAHSVQKRYCNCRFLAKIGSIDYNAPKAPKIVSNRCKVL